MEQQERVAWIDALRFLGILAIYVGHLGECSGRLYSFVWTYHVPLMFFVSGLMFAEKGRTFSAYLEQSFNRIMIPYYFFMLLSLSFYLLISPTPIMDAAVMLGKGLLAVKGIDFAQPLWFLPALFLIQCLFFLLKQVLRRTWSVFLLAYALYYLRTSVLSGISSLWIPYCADYALMYLVYYALGVAARWLLNTPLKKIWTNLLSLFLVGAMVYAFLFFCGHDLLAALPAVPRFPAAIGFLRVSLLISANILAAHIFSRVEGIQRIGRTTLYMVGNEVLVKTAVPTALAIVGLSCNPSGELGAILYCCALLFIIEHVVIPLEKPLLDILCFSKKLERKGNK